MMPIVHGLEEEFAGQITILRLNAAEPANAQWMEQAGLRGHPALILLDSNGRTAATWVGPQTTETLRTAIQTVIP